MLLHLRRTNSKGSATYGTRVTLGTPINSQWHAEAPSFTYQFVMIHTEGILTLTCVKIRM